jgi:hypothetical protein
MRSEDRRFAAEANDSRAYAPPSSKTASKRPVNSLATDSGDSGSVRRIKNIWLICGCAFLLSSQRAMKVVFDPQISQMFRVIARYRYRR